MPYRRGRGVGDEVFAEAAPTSYAGRMRGLTARLGIGLVLASSVVFAACGDLFHGTDWPSECDLHPDAPRCPPPTSNGSGANAPAGGGGSTGTTKAGGSGGGGGACKPGETRCGAACVDTKSNAKHCGKCDTSCSSSETCSASACEAEPSCRQLLVDHPNAASGTYTIDPDGKGGAAPFQVYCDMSIGSGYTLVLKLAADQFCFGSTRWTDDMPYNEADTLDASLPTSGAFDAKSPAFYLLSDTTELLFLTATGSVVTTFAGPASPKTLMTTQSIAFAAYPDAPTWRTAFGHDRNQAPIFMRAGMPEIAGNICRTNPQVTPSGCGQPCVFCYQASDGDCCGCDATLNDTNSGIGNNATYCGAGLANCSAAGMFSNPIGVALVLAH